MTFLKFSENEEVISDITKADSDGSNCDKKMKFRTKIKLGFFALCIAIIVVIIVAVNYRNKIFMNAVDKFCKDWEKLNLEMEKNEPDALEIDIRYKILLVDMSEISKYYEQLKFKSSANKYLKHNINQYMFHEVANYHEREGGQVDRFSNELYEFYENPIEYLGVKVSNIEFYSGADGYIHCKGSVTNDSVSWERYVAADVYFRDKEGNVIRYDRYGLIGENRLEAGDTKEFDFNSYIKEGVDSCDMVIDK